MVAIKNNWNETGLTSWEEFGNCSDIKSLKKVWFPGDGDVYMRIKVHNIWVKHPTRNLKGQGKICCCAVLCCAVSLSSSNDRIGSKSTSNTISECTPKESPWSRSVYSSLLRGFGWHFGSRTSGSSYYC